MHLEMIREALHKLPFEPFVIRLVDGRQLTVPHPDFVAVSNRRVLVISPQDESVTWFEPLLIVSIDHAGTGQGTLPSGKGV